VESLRGPLLGARFFASIVLATLALSATAPSPARADDEADARHGLELTVGGGVSLSSERPEELQLAPGGQFTARAMLDLGEFRFDAWGFMPDATRPELFHVRGDARVFFLTLHDFTMRRTPEAELVRFMAGVGSESDIPGGAGRLMFDLGVIGVRVGRANAGPRPVNEAYGAYLGLTMRLRVGEVRDELRIAAHGMTRPTAFPLGFSVDAMFASMAWGVTASNRFYVQAVRAGPFSMGPEVHVQLEMLVEGMVFTSTVGAAGTLGF
jgi:hypothetical protein